MERELFGRIPIAVKDLVLQNRSYHISTMLSSMKKAWCYLLLATNQLSFAEQCASDEDCSLNGICTTGQCICDPGWIGNDCGALDLRPANRAGGYNRTGEGVSSWGSRIVCDPKEAGLYHLFFAEFTHGCGLDYWSPYSRIMHAESRTGPDGPYDIGSEVVGHFSHNPTVVYSPAEKLYLLYYIGCPQTVSPVCTAPSFTCGPGNYINGESGISVQTSPDLITWTHQGQVFAGEDNSDWDADLTNPSPLPLYSDANKTSAMLLAYRGCPANCSGAEQIDLAVSSAGFKGPYSKVQPDPVFSNGNEDPFIWRDKRGNYHLLLHSLEADGGFGSGPKVGRHAFAPGYEGPWTFNSATLAYSTLVQYDDGTEINFYRRERPQLFFSDDGAMTPLFLTTGVQENGSPMSYSVIVPIGERVK